MQCESDYTMTYVGYNKQLKDEEIFFPPDDAFVCYVNEVDKKTSR